MPPLTYLGKSGRAIKKPRGTGSGSFYFEIDDKAIARVQKKFQRASGRSLQQRMLRGNLARGDELAVKMKSAAPKGPTGNLRKSIKARRDRRSYMGVLVGPMARVAPHRHLVIRGTALRSSVGPRSSSMYRAFDGHVFHRSQVPYTGRMTANPFVDRVSRGYGRKAADLVLKEWTVLLR